MHLESDIVRWVLGIIATQLMVVGHWIFDFGYWALACFRVGITTQCVSGCLGSWLQERGWCWLWCPCDPYPCTKLFIVRVCVCANTLQCSGGRVQIIQIQCSGGANTACHVRAQVPKPLIIRHRCSKCSCHRLKIITMTIIIIENIDNFNHENVDNGHNEKYG